MIKYRKSYKSKIKRKIKSWSGNLPMFIMNLNGESGQTAKIYSRRTATLLTQKGWYYLV